MKRRIAYDNVYWKKKKIKMFVLFRKFCFHSEIIILKFILNGLFFTKLKHCTGNYNIINKIVVQIVIPLYELLSQCHYSDANFTIIRTFCSVTIIYNYQLKLLIIHIILCLFVFFIVCVIFVTFISYVILSYMYYCYRYYLSFTSKYIKLNT